MIRYHYHSVADSTLPRSDKIGYRRAIASLMPSHPLLSAIAAFAGHFAIDAIPHWDWRAALTSQVPFVRHRKPRGPSPRSHVFPSN
jgi:hypothetical protein